MFDFSNFKVRCSAIGKTLSNAQGFAPLTENQVKELAGYEAKLDAGTITEKQKEEMARLQMKREKSKELVLGETCTTYLMEEYSWRVYGKKSVSKEVDIEYTQKGKEVEAESILLLSRVDKVLYEKNTERVENEFLSGEPDVYSGPSILQAESVTDTKSIWDHPGFLKKTRQAIDPEYDWQLKGYGDITGAKKLQVANCLVNMSEPMIYQFLQRLLRQMNVISEESPEYVKKATELENSMRFDDIPIYQRVYKVPVEPMNDHDRTKVYDRVKQCRDWLNNYHEFYQKLNK